MDSKKCFRETSLNAVNCFDVLFKVGDQVTALRSTNCLM